MIKYYEGDGRLSLVTEHNGVLYLTGRTSEGKEPARATVQADMALEDRLVEMVVTAVMRE